MSIHKYEASAKDARTGFNAFVKIEWSDKPEEENSFHTTLSNTYDRITFSAVKKDSISSDAIAIDYKSLPTNKKLTEVEDPKYININSGEEVSEKTAKKDPQSYKRFQKYKILSEYDTSELEEFGYLDKTYVTVTAIISITCIAYEISGKYYWHCTNVELSDFIFDPDCLFELTNKCIFEDQNEQGKIIYDLSDYFSKITLIKGLNRSYFHPAFDLSLKYFKVVKKGKADKEFEGTFTRTDLRTIEFIYENQSLEGLRWKVDFKVDYILPLPGYDVIEGEKYTRENLGAILDVNSIQDLEDFNMGFQIYAIELVSLECDTSNIAEDNILKEDNTLYVIQTNLAKGLKGENQEIIFKYGSQENRSRFKFNHYDPKVKLITNWPWTYKDKKTNQIIIENINVSYYKYEKYFNKGNWGNGTIKKITCEIWYLLIPGSLQPLRLYEVTLTAESIDSTAEINLDQLLGEPANTDNLPAIEPEIPASTSETASGDSDETNPLNTTAGSVGEAGVAVDKEISEDQTGALVHALEGGRSDDIQTFAQKLKEENEKLQEKKDEVARKVNDIKKNKKIQELLVNAETALSTAKKAYDTYNAFKESTLSGITQATSLGGAVAETLIKDVFGLIIKNKLKKFLKFADTKKNTFEGLFKAHYINIKNLLVDAFSNVRLGPDDIMTLINNIQSTCLSLTRKTFETFVTDIEKEANKIIDGINQETLDLTKQKIETDLKEETNKVKHKKEVLQKNAEQKAKAAVDSAMSTLRAKTAGANDKVSTRKPRKPSATSTDTTLTTPPTNTSTVGRSREAAERHREK